MGAAGALQSTHMITGIEHVAIASPDPLRLALWYVEHLDFVINYQPAQSRTVFIKAADGSMIEIIESAPATVPDASMNAAGLRQAERIGRRDRHVFDSGNHMSGL